MKFRFIFFFLLLIIFSSVYGFEEGFELSSEGTINYIGSGEEGALYDFYLCDNCEVSESTKNILMEEFPKLAERLEVGKIPSPELKAELNEEIIDEIDKKNGAFLKEVEGIKEHLKKKLKEDEKYRIKLVEGEYIHLENKEGKDFIKIPMGCYSFESTQFSLDFLAKGKCKKDLEIMGSRIHSVSKGTQISTYSVDSEIPTYGSNIERIKLFGEGTFLYGSSEIRTLSEKSEIRLEKEGNMARFSISSSENLELKLYGQKFDKLYAAHFTIDETKDELISGEFYNGDEEAIYDLSFFGESLVFQLEPLGSLFFERDEEEGLLVGGKKAIFRFENKEIFSPNFQATFDTKNKNFKRIYFSSGSRYEEQKGKAKSIIYFENPTEYFFELNKCKGSEYNCIERDITNNFFNVFAKGNSKITFVDNAEIINSFGVPLILDESEITYVSSWGDKILFSDEPFKLDIKSGGYTLPIVFGSEFLNEKGQLCYQIMGSPITQDCQTENMISIFGSISVREFKLMHDNMIDETGYGAFFGVNSNFNSLLNKYDLTPEQGIAFEKMMRSSEFIRDAGNYDSAIEMALKIVRSGEIPDIYVPDMEPKKTSCIDWCVLNFEEAFKRAKLSSEWKRIEMEALKRSANTPTAKQTGSFGMMGTELAKTLVDEGWEAIYYTPDSRLPRDKPLEIPPPPNEDKKSSAYKAWRKKYMAWEEHTFTASMAKTKGSYYPYGIDLVDYIVDYRPTSGDLTEIEGKETPTSQEGLLKLEKLRNVPFGLVVTRGGRHTALFSYGKIYEVHYSKDPNRKNLVDITNFEDWPWLSGVIVIPPENWGV